MNTTSFDLGICQLVARKTSDLFHCTDFVDVIGEGLRPPNWTKVGSSQNGNKQLDKQKSQFLRGNWSTLLHGC